MAKEKWISVTEATRMLEMGYQRCREAMFRGKLGKTRKKGRFWEVTEAGVKKYAAERKKAAAKNA